MGFVVLKSKRNLNPASGFEHVKGHAGLADFSNLGVAANMFKHKSIVCDT